MTTKNQDKRSHNVFFNLHTVSGIAISVGLFVIFLAGAFALFLNNIHYWEHDLKPEARKYITVDYDRVLDSLENTKYELYDRTLSISTSRNGERISLRAQGLKPHPAEEEMDSKKLAKAATGRISMNLSSEDYQKVKRKPFKRGIGGFLYHLHFFEQIPTIGVYLSGFVALFFLMAIVSGIIVHWKKIVSNFFTFRLKASVKNLWTDAHTALGVIGIPFQLMYAVTGSLFGLTTFIFIPVLLLVGDGDRDKTVGYIYPSRQVYETTGKMDQNKCIRINDIVDNYLADFDPNRIKSASLRLQNYQDENAHLTVTVNDNNEKSFYKKAYAIFRLSDGEIVHQKKLDSQPHNDSVIQFMHLIHYGSYGGYFVKLLYFVMAIVTCFVIISGVMIWLRARDNKKYADKSKFNTNVGAIYLGASIGLYPAIAFIFCAAKVVPYEWDDRLSWVTNSFYLFWLFYTIYAFFIKDYFKINKRAFLLAGILGLCIPVLNAIRTGRWFWESIQQEYMDAAFIDIAWLCLGILSLLAVKYMKPVLPKPKSTKKSKTSENSQKKKPTFKPKITETA